MSANDKQNYNWGVHIVGECILNVTPAPYVCVLTRAHNSCLCIKLSISHKIYIHIYIVINICINQYRSGHRWKVVCVDPKRPGECNRAAPGGSTYSAGTPTLALAHLLWRNLPGQKFWNLWHEILGIRNFGNQFSAPGNFSIYLYQPLCSIGLTALGVRGLGNFN